MKVTITDWRLTRRDQLEDLVDEYARFVIDDLDKRAIKEAQVVIASDSALEPLVQAIERCRHWIDVPRLVDELSVVKYHPDTVTASEWWHTRFAWHQALKAYQNASVYDRAEAVLRMLQQEGL